MQLDIVGGAPGSGFRQLKVILGSGLFRKLKAYFMVCLFNAARPGIGSSFHRDLRAQTFYVLTQNVTEYVNIVSEYQSKQLFGFF